MLGTISTIEHLMSAFAGLGVTDADVLVKGGDWPIERIVSSAETLARGGQVHSIPFEFETSTTAMLNRIRAQG